MEPTTAPALSLEELQAENARLRQEVAELRELLAAALAEIERLKRDGKRQAAPFSKGKRVANPKKPGRKPGEGRFRRREAPAPEEITRHVPVPVEDRECPRCGGELETEKVETATVTDVPAVVKLERTAFHREVCRCLRCQGRVWGRHPELPDDQRGATAHRLGPRLLALAQLLHYEIGIPVRKVPRVLRAFCGVCVTQGALTQDALRRARRAVGDAYTALKEQLRQEDVVNTDDTGWKVGGAPAFLMAFVGSFVAVFQIRRQHRNVEVREAIGDDYAGTLGCDGGRSYDARKLADKPQQKCLSHVLRLLSEALAGQRGRPRHFGLRLAALLREAIALWRRRGTMVVSEYEAEVVRLGQAVTYHLRWRRYTNDANRRLQSELGHHHGKGNLLRFLTSPGVEPTNNRAERALRPAVIARKVSHCSKSEGGADAHAVFVSVLYTMRLRGIDPLDGLVSVFETGRVPDPPT